MQAIVLVGGSGSRLRPLSQRTPKQLAPVLNRPLLDHLLCHLRQHGIDRVTLAMTAESEPIREAMGDGSHLGLAITYAYEAIPLGSGGAIASIAGGWDEPFLVCNGDIVTDLDLTAMIAEHHRRGAELSMSLFEVPDPSPFGVVEVDSTGRIRRFVEKPAPAEASTRLVNAGTWIFDPSLLPGMEASLYHRVEDTLFPALCAAGRAVYGIQGAHYWADVGDAHALLRVNLDLARGVLPAWPAPPGGAVVHEQATIATNASIDAPAVIGSGAIIENGARVAESLLWDDVHVGAGSTVRRSILATGVRVGAGSIIEDAVIAHEVHLDPGSRVTGGAIEAGAALAGDTTHG